MEIVGYRNMREFRQRFEPFYLRRRYEDVRDVKVPEVLPPQTEWFDLHPAQRAKYEQLQDEVLTIIKESGEEEIRHAIAWTKFGYGAQICAGLPALGEADGPGASVKLDWLVKMLTTDWSSEKVVVFSRYKGTIRAMQSRLAPLDIDMALIWGDTPGDSRRKQQLRQAEQDRFWNDPRCRVAVGTSAIERSLNFQIARIIVNFDLLLNPARMTQILGRIRRVGSSHSHVLPVNLLARHTQEEGYMRVLEQRAALSSYVFDESSDLFKALSPMELLQLIRP
jgi:SNF2 family DNA or RNA helicase